jgi:hypothetical protein
MPRALSVLLATTILVCSLQAVYPYEGEVQKETEKQFRTLCAPLDSVLGCFVAISTVGTTSSVAADASMPAHGHANSGSYHDTEAYTKLRLKCANAQCFLIRGRLQAVKLAYSCRNLPHNT